jgi:chromosome segregation ATPase
VSGDLNGFMVALERESKVNEMCEEALRIIKAQQAEIDRLQAEITRLRAVNASLVVRNREMAQELADLKNWRHALQESLSEIEGSAEELARTFHETYERLAPQFHYETREASAVPWHLVPAVNRNLMIAVAAEILWGGPS